MHSVTGHAITDDEWTVHCPECEHVMHYLGYFDPEDECICDGCKITFYCTKIYFDDGSYIK